MAERPEPFEPLVYGEGRYGWLVLPQPVAKYWAQVWEALESGTWGELRAAAGPETFDEWFDEERPDEDTTVDGDAVPGYADGDFPPTCGALMLKWLPPELHGLYGEVVNMTLNGRRLDLEGQDEAERLVAELRGSGRTVERDDGLLGRLGPF